MIFDAVVLAGGRSSRLGGTAKSSLIVGGTSLLDTAVAATTGARRTVVVAGDGVPAIPGTIRAIENPPFGGPTAAIGAGLSALMNCEPQATWVLVLACDMPRVADVVPALLRAAHADGAVAVDGEGAPQYLAAAYRPAALAAAINNLGSLDGTSVKALVAGLDLARVLSHEATRDIDTWDDAARFGVRHASDPHTERRL